MAEEWLTVLNEAAESMLEDINPNWCIDETGGAEQGEDAYNSMQMKQMFFHGFTYALTMFENICHKTSEGGNVLDGHSQILSFGSDGTCYLGNLPDPDSTIWCRAKDCFLFLK